MSKNSEKWWLNFLFRGCVSIIMVSIMIAIIKPEIYVFVFIILSVYAVYRIIEKTVYIGERNE